MNAKLEKLKKVNRIALTETNLSDSDNCMTHSDMLFLLKKIILEQEDKINDLYQMVYQSLDHRGLIEHDE